jgi:autotransporter translocation and assembly factor TamB
LRRNNTGINFDLNLGLQNREFTPSSPFTARIILRQADVGELLSMAGYDYPATGTVNLSAQLAGTRSDPEGNGNIQISAATIHGQPVQRFGATLSFSKGDVVLQNIEMAQAAARVTGNARYAFLSHAFTADLSGAHFDLARAPMFDAGRIAVEGQFRDTRFRHSR